MIKLKEIVCHTKKSEQFMTDVSRSGSETPEYLHRFESKADGRLKACACVCVCIKFRPLVRPIRASSHRGGGWRKGARERCEIRLVKIALPLSASTPGEMPEGGWGWDGRSGKTHWDKTEQHYDFKRLVSNCLHSASLITTRKNCQSAWGFFCRLHQ